MSLIDAFKEPCVVMNKAKVSDGEGGFTTVPRQAERHQRRRPRTDVLGPDAARDPQGFRIPNGYSINNFNVLSVFYG